jgi:hypothetical protein
MGSVVQMTMRDFNVANENIDRTIEVVEDILLQFDIARRVTAPVPFVVTSLNGVLL